MVRASLPENWLRAGELNAARMAYEARQYLFTRPQKTWSGKLGSNQRPLDYRSSAQTTLSFSRLCYLCKEWSPVPLTGLVILEPMERIERSSAGARGDIRNPDLRGTNAALLVNGAQRTR